MQSKGGNLSPARASQTGTSFPYKFTICANTWSFNTLGFLINMHPYIYYYIWQILQPVRSKGPFLTFYKVKMLACLFILKEKVSLHSYSGMYAYSGVHAYLGP